MSSVGAVSGFDKPNFVIRNKPTLTLGKIAIALGIITLLGGAMVLAHYGIGVGGNVLGTGSDILAIGGAGTVISTAIYGCLRIRDWREKKLIEKAWNESDKTKRDDERTVKERQKVWTEESMKNATSGDSVNKKFKLDINGKRQIYWFQAIKDQKDYRVKITKQSVVKN